MTDTLNPALLPEVRAFEERRIHIRGLRKCNDEMYDAAAKSHEYCEVTNMRECEVHRDSYYTWRSTFEKIAVLEQQYWTDRIAYHDSIREAQ